VYQLGVPIEVVGLHILHRRADPRRQGRGLVREDVPEAEESVNIGEAIRELTVEPVEWPRPKEMPAPEPVKELEPVEVEP
jgi:hypothetical protein